MVSRGASIAIGFGGLVLLGGGNLAYRHAQDRTLAAYGQIPRRVVEIEQELNGLLLGEEPYQQIEYLVATDEGVEHARNLLEELHDYNLAEVRDARREILRQEDCKNMGLTFMLGGGAIAACGAIGVLRKEGKE